MERAKAIVRGVETTISTVDIEVEPKELVSALLGLCGLPSGVFIKDDIFVTSKELSYPGSPVYSHTEHSPKQGTEKLARAALEVKSILIEAKLAYPCDFN